MPGAVRLSDEYWTPNRCTPLVVRGVANAFLTVCVYAKSVLPKLSTGVAHHDNRDKELFAEIDQAASRITNWSRGRA